MACTRPGPPVLIGAVIAPPRNALSTVLAMFCVALSLVFATASAASVLDRLEHQRGEAHHHQRLSFSDLSFDDHHQAGEHADHGMEQGEDGASQTENGPGHHHHGEGPSAAPASGALMAVHAPPAAGRLAGASDAARLTRALPGPERPPKAFAKRA